MKKLLCLSCIAVLCAFASGCARETDYTEYISELRYDVFIYSGDSDEIKVYCSERESPYAADGVKGEMENFTEVYATFGKSYENVTVEINDESGEMSYLTVKNCWYLSFSGGRYETDTLAAKFSLGGQSCEYTLISVLSDGVMDGASALGCVMEYDGDIFSGMTTNGIFCGEIYIRLLYDEKCYYYVGVCDRSGNIKAYLADSETGRIIAEHSSTA
ncbi:MAG: hypothetical protein LUI60_01530 [Clostridia bacterium]|nr:hypothetical protein [Clostridia bacterium]